MSTEHFLSNEFLSWFHNHFKQSLSEKSFSLYLHYAGTFSKAIGKDFLDYEKEDADFYCSILRSHMEEGVIKPKSVYNEIAILSSIAKALEDSLQIPDFFSAQERPVIEYAPLSEQRLPSTSEFDTILSVAQNYDPSGITRYALELATLFHKFYNACHVSGVEQDLMMARLALCDAVRIGLHNTLAMMKLDAPESM